MAELTLDTLADDGQYARIENKLILDELERKKKARSLAVPTDDNKVKARLREIGEPITIFGERAADRRDRLIYVLSQINAARGEGTAEVEESSSEEEEAEAEEFYTEGTVDLLEARRSIAEYSLPRAQKRIAQQRIDSRIQLGKLIDLRKKIFTNVKSFANLGSQIGDQRPIAQVRFSPNSKILATGSWSGNVRLWNVPACTPISTLAAHSDRVGGVAWHPQATLSQSETVVNLVSGGADGTLALWSLKSESPLSVLEGHEERVCRVAFHPSGRYVASASFDTSWRLWDVEKGKELLLQEGHSKEVYTVAFQGDGSLIASGGLDAIGRVWDTRTGRTAVVLDGHVQPILGLDFSPNGYQLATGSGDDTIRIWDMRASKALYTIPAHTSNVADVRFYQNHEMYSSKSGVEVNDFPEGEDGDVNMADESGDLVPSKPGADAEEWRLRSGMYLASAGYDGFVKLWSADDWYLLKTFPTDSGKVMSVDLSPDAQLLASGTYMRNFQLFAPEEVPVL